MRLLVLLLLALPGASVPAFGHPRAFDPAHRTLEELRAALDAHRTSSEQLVRYYLDRIDRLDKRGPHINALITLNPKALEQAQYADAHAPGSSSPLYGIPFIVKDNYDTAGIPTSGGSAALAHSIPSTNAVVVQRLLDRGAILIGKANMSELAASYGRMGYSSAGGLTVNPYNTARDVSGSSSGSAAAVAADFAPFALGTDTSGSIRGPASVAGLVGLRPTLGLTSRSGVIPLASSFDTTGVLTRTAADQAIVLEAIAGPDPNDVATEAAPAGGQGYRQALDARSLEGARLGVVTSLGSGPAMASTRWVGPGQNAGGVEARGQRMEVRLVSPSVGRRPSQPRDTRRSADHPEVSVPSAKGAKSAATAAADPLLEPETSRAVL